MNPPTTDQWELWPPTPVSLASLSMEAAPGLVGGMECGVGHLQHVKVSIKWYNDSTCTMS